VDPTYRGMGDRGMRDEGIVGFGIFFYELLYVDYFGLYFLCLSLVGVLEAFARILKTPRNHGLKGDQPCIWDHRMGGRLIFG
jgi:hypothetical protein